VFTNPAEGDVYVARLDIDVGQPCRMGGIARGRCQHFTVPHDP
jgi:hypothetical protein